MKVHLVDGTFELFRQWFGAPKATNAAGMEIGATRGMLRTMLGLLTNDGATHVAVAYDRVIESFRNELFVGYKTGAGIEPELLAQFPLAERATRALGITLWPMVEFEADDALATGAKIYAPHAEQVRLCTPDKDLAQCVQSDRVVLVDRIRKKVTDEEGVIAKYGVPPASIPDYLALVGDTADGIPGIPRWGAKSTSTVLTKFGTVDAIPADPADWGMKVRGSATLASNLNEQRGEAALYKVLATLRTDVPLQESVDDLEWKGARRELLVSLCEELDYERFLDRVPRFRED